MSNDVPYRHPDTGQERLLPEGTGEKLGYERMAGFTPPEISEPIAPWSLIELAEGEFYHAATLVFGVVTKGAEEVSDSIRETLQNLAASLIEHGFGPAVAESDPADLPVSVPADALAQLTERVEKDAKISNSSREQILHHIKMVSTAPTPVVPPDQAPVE